MPSVTKNPIRIVILDNHALVRAGIRLLIESQPGMEIVGEAGNLSESIEVVINNTPDIILLELNLAEQESSVIIPSILKVSEQARLILVTGNTDPQVHQLAVENGVMGVIYKTQPPEILLKAIEKVFAGEV